MTVCALWRERERTRDTRNPRAISSPAIAECSRRSFRSLRRRGYLKEDGRRKRDRFAFEGNGKRTRGRLEAPKGESRSCDDRETISLRCKRLIVRRRIRGTHLDKRMLGCLGSVERAGRLDGWLLHSVTLITLCRLIDRAHCDRTTLDTGTGIRNRFALNGVLIAGWIIRFSHSIIDYPARPSSHWRRDRVRILRSYWH